MALAVTITDFWHDGKRLNVVGTIVPSGNYPNPGGDVLSFAGKELPVCCDKVPISLTVTARGYGGTLLYNKGTKRDDGKCKAMAPGGAEQVNGAYAAGFLAETFDFVAVFQAL